MEEGEEVVVVVVIPSRDARESIDVLADGVVDFGKNERTDIGSWTMVNTLSAGLGGSGGLRGGVTKEPRS